MKNQIYIKVALICTIVGYIITVVSGCFILLQQQQRRQQQEVNHHHQNKTTTATTEPSTSLTNLPSNERIFEPDRIWNMTSSSSSPSSAEAEEKKEQGSIHHDFEWTHGNHNTTRNATFSAAQPRSLAAVPSGLMGRTIFYALGDAPYSGTQMNKLKNQMKSLPTDAEFVIHLGDIRGVNPPTFVCTSSEYGNVANALKLSPKPVFIVLGDNDWNDCSNPDQAFGYWKNQFLEFDKRFFPNHNPFCVRRQLNRNENFSFVHKGTLFIGLNIVGGRRILDIVEWNRRLIEQYNWLVHNIALYRTTIGGSSVIGRIIIFGHAGPTSSHDPFFLRLRSYIQTVLLNQIPILYIHGDNHRWIYETNYLGQPSFVRIGVTGLTVDPLLKISVTATGRGTNVQDAFKYDRRL